MTERERPIFFLLVSVSAFLLQSAVGAASIATDSATPADGRCSLSLEDANLSASPPACGPASMAIALKLLNCSFTNDELTRLADSQGDSTFAELAEFAQHKGLYAVAVRLGPGQLLKLHRIAILQILSPLIINGVHAPHFIVFAGPVPGTDHGPWWNKDSVFLFDSVAGDGLRGPLPIEALSEMYTGNALVLSKYPVDPNEFAVAHAESPHDSWRTIRDGSMAGLGAAAILLFCATLRRKTGSTTMPTVAPTIAMVIYMTLFSASFNSAAADSSNPTTRPAGDSAATINSNANQLCDVGNVSKGEQVQHSFEFTNSKPIDIDLQIAGTSCTCLSARFDGPSHLRPGQKTNVVLSAIARNGGPVQTSALIKTSAQEMFLLTIQMAVINDTDYSPRTVDFGDVWADQGKQSRPLHFTHYTSNAGAFKDFLVRSFSPCVSVSLDKPTWTSGSDGAKTVDENVTITLDPALASLGPLGKGILATASDGNKKLSFTIDCIGQVVPIVGAIPDQIAVFGANLPNEIPASVTLKAVDGRLVNVETIEASNLTIAKWTATPSGDGTINLEIIIQPNMLQGRAQGSLHVKFIAPKHYMLDIPVRVVDTTSR